MSLAMDPAASPRRELIATIADRLDDAVTRLDALIEKSTTQMPKLFANRRIELGYEQALGTNPLVSDTVAEDSKPGWIPRRDAFWRFGVNRINL